MKPDESLRLRCIEQAIAAGARGQRVIRAAQAIERYIIGATSPAEESRR